MVKSGLREVARVSPYFLAAHLFFALLLLLAVVRRIVRERIARRKFFVSRAVRACCFSVAFVSVVTFLMGAFVAGLGAGGIHNDWPLMSGSFVPSDYALLEPWWRNALENPSAVQFEHRFLALLLLLGCFVLFVFLRQSSVRMDWHARGLLFLPLLQVLLGGFVLWWRVPVLLGVVPPAPAVSCCHGCILLREKVENERTYSIWEKGMRMSTFL